MAERYSRLYTLPANLYHTGAPVVVSAGALLKDNQYNHVLAQLKIRNISQYVIKAVTVAITTYDTAGRKLEEITEYTYLDLTARRDDFFGQQTAFTIRDNAVRSFSVAVTEVVFAAEVWNGANDPWTEQLSEPVALENSEMSKQYAIDLRTDVKNTVYEPQQIDDLWYCTCGALNNDNDSQCHSCNIAKNDIFAAFNKDMLLEHLSVRLKEEEKARAELAEKQRAERQAKQEKAEQRRAEQKIKFKKWIKVFIPAVLIIAIIAGGISFALKAHAYNEAISLIDEGNYQQAILYLAKADGYKDARELNMDIHYQIGEKTITAGSYHTIGLKADGKVVATGDNEDGQ